MELKALRERSKLNQKEVVAELDWSQSKLIRIENGSVGVSVTDVRALLGLYKASEETVDELVALARAARVKRWWTEYRDVISPRLQEFMGFEADATHLRQFHATLVPGLLQIEAYIRAVGPDLMLTPISDERSEYFVRVRLRRQKELLHSEHPPAFTAVVDEAVLHRQVGGAEAMRAQLLHLADLQSRGKVSLGIVPFSAGAHFGMMGSFHILELIPDEPDSSLLYLEDAQSAILLQDNPELMAQYQRRFDELLEMSVRGDEAVRFLRKLSEATG
ncbi:MAG TPA: helix-turn-helix transcriptional regulator [Candidatus Limnocylindrales bacterium]|nr:helix-turn-helix transcriptional regulator [Candidatus Limnocylindrales bacterium]